MELNGWNMWKDYLMEKGDNKLNEGVKNMKGMKGLESMENIKSME